MIVPQTNWIFWRCYLDLWLAICFPSCFEMSDLWGYLNKPSSSYCWRYVYLKKKGLPIHTMRFFLRFSTSHGMGCMDVNDTVHTVSLRFDWIMLSHLGKIAPCERAFRWKKQKKCNWPKRRQLICVDNANCMEEIVKHKVCLFRQNECL